jgi:hypothetical protein
MPKLETIANDKTITAHDLLIRFLELQTMTPNYDEWAEESLSDNPPRLIRLRQLTAIFQAFGIPWDPRSFVRGTFIQPDLHPYHPLLSRLSTESENGLMNYDWTDHKVLRIFFEILIDYRIHVESVRSYPHRIWTPSGVIRVAYNKICELSGIVENNIETIDGILTAVISPKMAAFSMEQMMRDYGYPDDNLEEIDIAWT